MKDDNFRSLIHDLHDNDKLAEEVLRYDLDHLDSVWLETFNLERRAMGSFTVKSAATYDMLYTKYWTLLIGAETVSEWKMEKIMESLETLCFNNMQTKMRTVEGLGIEYDEDVVCDVCKSVSSLHALHAIFSSQHRM